MQNPFVIDVEGLIGAGKSTLIEKLETSFIKKGYRVTLIKEPVDQWTDILPRFYNDPKRWGYHFQTKAFHDRVQESRQKWTSFASVTDIFITERGVLSDKIFMSTLHDGGNVDDMEWEHYLQWCDMWDLLMPFKPDIYVYLCPSMDETMKRVRMRNRNGEDAVSEEYQLLLQKKHNEVFGKPFAQLKNANIPVQIISTDSDFKTDENLIECIAKQLLQFTQI